MKVSSLFAYRSALACLGLIGAADLHSDDLTFPQTRGATFDEIRRHQSLGRTIVTSNEAFIVYEWARPFDWAPSTTDVVASAARRKQTFIYKVDLSIRRPTSEYLFQPAPGATYYLGDPSPNSKWISFYEVDRDNNRSRLGVVEIDGGISPNIVWLDLEPDDARLDETPVWTSNEELLFAAKRGATGLSRGNLVTGKVEGCLDCPPDILQKRVVNRQEHLLQSADRRGIPADAKLLARSGDSHISVFSVDTPDKLSLLFRKGPNVQTLFENDRQPSKRTVNN